VKLPARIRKRIRVQEEASEILVGWIQLAIVAGFGLVYLLAPKTHHADAPFRPVPWVLGLYLGFTLLRLVLAHRRALPQWFAYASIVIDMALLLGLIWSFHLQYMQPPSFYLKAPTLMYAFIFIALRALNFDARRVVFAGVVAAVGWTLLVVYVIRVDPRNSMITRDYVEYLTSNSVLIGAEVDKIIAILVVTGILGFAIRRSYRLLETSVVESASSRDLARFVPSEVADYIKRSDERVEVGEGITREATTLFLDIEGFTTLSERLEPSALVRTLNEFYAAVAEPIVRRDGVINQFQGDAVVATFNVPRDNADHAANALRAASEIHALLAARTFGDGAVLRARIGINTGVVVAGLIGTPDRLVYTVIGDEVNLAARLEALNKETGTRTLLSERTRTLAEAAGFEFSPIGEVRVRGRSAPTRVYALAAEESPTVHSATVRATLARARDSSAT
jgi:adenylate cyclase